MSMETANTRDRDDDARGLRLGPLRAYLVETAGLTLRGMGADDEKVKQHTEARIVNLFDRYLGGECSSGLVKWNPDGMVSVYDGRVYVRKKAECLKPLIRDVMAECGVGIVYQVNSVGKAFKQCMDNVEFRSNAFAPDRRYAAFANCVLDFKTGSVLEFSRDYETDVLFDFDYDPSARSVLWENFIQQTIPSDEMRLAFQMFCGAFFVDRKKIKVEKACYLIGTGRNGKSVAVSAISDTLGPDMVSGFSPQQLFTDNTAAYNRAAADGKLANFSDDVKASDYSGGDFKQFVSGKPFEARRIHHEPYTMRSVPFMVLCVNAMPPTTDDTDGHFRRVLPIMCPNKVSDADADPMLEDKLRSVECRQAIFNWMYDGYKMLIANGGKIPNGDTIKEMQSELKADSNSARRWLRDMGYEPCDVAKATDDKWRSFKELMDEYKKYCDDMAESAKSQKGVGMVLRELGYEYRRRSNGVFYCMTRRSVMGSEDETDLPF